MVMVDRTNNIVIAKNGYMIFWTIIIFLIN